jgi:hypothetical protein
MSHAPRQARSGRSRTAMAFTSSPISCSCVRGPGAGRVAVRSVHDQSGSIGANHALLCSGYREHRDISRPGGRRDHWASAGLLVMLRLFKRPAACVASGTMTVAYWIAHASKNLFPVNNGGDAAILFCFVFLYFVFAGALTPGALNEPVHKCCRPDAGACSSAMAARKRPPIEPRPRRPRMTISICPMSNFVGVIKAPAGTCVPGPSLKTPP